EQARPAAGDDVPLLRGRAADHVVAAGHALRPDVPDDPVVVAEDGDAGIVAGRRRGAADAVAGPAHDVNAAQNRIPLGDVVVAPQLHRVAAEVLDDQPAHRAAAGGEDQ